MIGATEGHVSGILGTAFKRRWATGEIPEILAWADCAGPAAEREIAEAGALVARGLADPASVAPGRLVSVGSMRPVEVDLRPVPRGPSDLAIVVPRAFAPGAQRWVLVDLDDLDAEVSWGREAALRRAGEIAGRDPRLSGRVALVETSWTGVQAWFELGAPVEARAFWRERWARAWHADLGAATLAAVHASGRSGGFPDPSAGAPGRYGRRPGWRLVDGFVPFRVRLIGLHEPDGAILGAAEIRLRARAA